MATYDTVFETTRPRDEVFEYLATFSNAQLWDPGVANGECLTPGPPAVGSVYRLGVRLLGRVVPFDYRVLELERPHRVVLRATHGRLVSTDAITVEPSGSGARVRYVANLEGRGVLRAASPLLARFFTRVADRAAAGLRGALT